MTKMQRTKGQAGEREAAALLRCLTGLDVRRRVRQHDGDHDLDLPGWSCEIKRHSRAGRAEIAAWWRQAVQQATHAPPLLLYRLDRAGWRVLWSPLGHPDHPVEADPSTWWAMQQQRSR